MTTQPIKALFAGEASYYTCRAKETIVLVLLSKTSFFSIVSTTSETVLSLAHSTIKELSPLVRKIDFALDWRTLEAGKRVLLDSQGSTFKDLSGSLRGYVNKQLCGEYGE